MKMNDYLLFETFFLSPVEVEIDLKRVNENVPGNIIILVTVINAIYPTNRSTLHKVCRNTREVCRI